MLSDRGRSRRSRGGAGKKRLQQELGVGLAMAWRMNQVASARRRDGRADGSSSSDGEAWPWKEPGARDASGGTACEVALLVVADGGGWRRTGAMGMQVVERRGASWTSGASRPMVELVVVGGGSGRGWT